MSEAASGSKSSGRIVEAPNSPQYFTTPPMSPSMYPMAAPIPLSLSGKGGEELFRISTPEDDRGRMIKQIKGLLNKITPEKYEVIANQIVGYFEPSTSDAIVPLIFEKALNELTFAEMYADLFRDLLLKVATCTQAHTTFLMALMLRCNLELTKALRSDEAQAQEGIPEKPDVERKSLKRSVGISQFIGELFVRDMLKEEFLFKVTAKLLRPAETPGAVTPMEAEVAAKLVETAGACWEAAAPRFAAELVPRIEALVEGHPKPRVRFLLQDLLELRQRGWQHRFAKQRPKKLSEGGLLSQARRSGSSGGGSPALAPLCLNPNHHWAGALDDPMRPRATTPPPGRGVTPLEHYVQQRRGLTPPPQRGPLFPVLGGSPASPLPIVGSLVASSSSQPPSPVPQVYQHNPYGYSSPQPSPATSPQPVLPMPWPDTAQSSWQAPPPEDTLPWPGPGPLPAPGPGPPWHPDPALAWHHQAPLGWAPDNPAPWSPTWVGDPYPLSPQAASPLLPQLSSPGKSPPLPLPAVLTRHPSSGDNAPHHGHVYKGRGGEKGDKPRPPPRSPGGSRRARPPDGSLPVPHAAFDALAMSPTRPARTGTPPSRALPIEPPPPSPGGPLALP